MPIWCPWRGRRAIGVVFSGLGDVTLDLDDVAVEEISRYPHTVFRP